MYLNFAQSNDHMQQHPKCCLSQLWVFGISRGVGGAVIPHQVRDRFPNGVRNLVRWGTRPFALLRVTIQWEILILTTAIPREPQLSVQYAVVMKLQNSGGGCCRRIWDFGENELERCHLVSWVIYLSRIFQRILNLIILTVELS